MIDGEVRELAEFVRASYGPGQLDAGVDRPTIVVDVNGFRVLAVPRAEMDEPWRSFRLVDAAAVGTTLVITFLWGEDDVSMHLLPYDARALELDLSDDIAVTTFLNHLVEFTLGGPRESWRAARSTPHTPRFEVVRPWQEE